MLLFSCVLIVALRTCLAVQWSAAFVPLGVTGAYYVAADSFHLTQLEILVSFPIFVALWLAAKIEGPLRQLAVRYFFSGVFAGITVVFKLVYAPLFVTLWAIALGYALVRQQRSLRQMAIYMMAPVTLGVVPLLVAVAAKFWYDGALRELLWTAFVYPAVALQKAPAASLLRLFESAMFYLSFSSMLLIFVVIAVADWWYSERDLFGALLIAWLVAGVGVIVVQKFSWWPYHFLTLFAPGGILAVRGCNAIPSRLLRRQQITQAQCSFLVLLMLLSASAGLSLPAWQKISAHILVFHHEKGGAKDFKRFVSGSYADIAHSVRFLSSDTARPGKIYVFGNPLYYMLSGRDPALPIIGWPWQYFLDAQWVYIPKQLAHAKPPYIYVDRENDKLMKLRGGGVRDYLLENYAPFTTDRKGTWYQTRLGKPPR